LLVSVVIVLAFVCGMTAQAMPPTHEEGVVAAGMAMPGCSDMAMALDADEALPAKGMTLDCVKSMHCLGILAMPARASVAEVPVRYTFVAYWSGARFLHGVSITPSPFPPRPV